MKKKIFITLFVIVGGGLFLWTLQFFGFFFEPGGAGFREEVPDMTVIGEPIVLRAYPSLWGGSAKQNIDTVYPGADLYYRLSGEENYKNVTGKPIPLPPNYQTVVSAGNKWKAFEFIIPPYPKGTIGEVEYYFIIQDRSNPNHPDGTFRVDGIKKVKLEAFDPLKNIDRPSSQIIVD